MNPSFRKGDATITESEPQMHLDLVQMEVLGWDQSDPVAMEGLVENWLNTYDPSGFDSEALYMEAKLAEALRITDGGGTGPGPISRLRTAMCCHLFDRLACNMGYFRPVMDQIKHELYRSIYYGYDYNKAARLEVNDAMFMGAKPFFVQNAKLDSENASMKRQVLELMSEVGAARRDANIANRILEKTMSSYNTVSLVSSFKFWVTAKDRNKHMRQVMQNSLSRILGRSIDIKEVMHAWMTLTKTKALRRKEEARRKLEKEGKQKEVKNRILQQQAEKDKEEIENLRKRMAAMEKELAAAREAAANAAENSEYKAIAAAATRRAEIAEKRCQHLAAFSHAVGEACFNRLAADLEHARGTMPVWGWLMELAYGKFGPEGEQLTGSLTSDVQAVPTVEGAMDVIRRGGFDLMLLNWADNKQLASTGAVGRRAGDFGESFDDGEKFSAIVKAMVPSGVDTGTTNYDTSRRLQRAFVAAQEHLDGSNFLDIANVVQVQGNEDLVGALLARLFTVEPVPVASDFPGGQTFYDDERAKLDNVNESLETAQCKWPGVAEVLTALSFPTGSDSLLEDKIDKVIGGWRAEGSKEDADIVILGDSIQRMSEHLRASTVLVVGAERMWRDLRHRALEFSWRVMRGRILAKPEVMLDERKAAEVRAYTTLRRGKLKDLLKEVKISPDSEAAVEVVIACEDVLRDHCEKLTQVFKFYAAGVHGGSAVTMSSQEFWKFIKDCHIQDKNLTSAQIDLIFSKCNIDDKSSDLSEVLMGRSNPDAEFVPPEWVESLVRLGAAKFSKKSSWGLPERLQELITTHVLPFACRTDVSLFRSMICDEDVQGVFKKHRTSLEKIFRYYAEQDGVKGQGTMNQQEFSMLLRDASLVDATLNESQISSIFANIQDDDYMAMGEEGAVGGGDTEMVYQEFLEAMAAITIYKMPNPYLPLSQRLDTFLTKELSPMVKVAKKNAN